MLLSIPMRTFIPVIFFILTISNLAEAQITSPVIKANFGVDADLRSNFFSGSTLNGNDDWFTQTGTPGSGIFVIDTTGAAAIVSGYNSNMAFRRTTFSRGMSYPVLSTVNGHLLLDAAFVRDFHGDDSTVFASGGNKNGETPANWNCPVAQGIPDKNDILDMMVHVRRAGASFTDSLWMMGGLSLDNTTGNRYFDFEMYQTDLVYDRAIRKFEGYGPDQGHTSWEFDADGNIIRPGDIIFSAEYQSSSLTFIEARIWVSQASLSITPNAFSWSGEFDGESSGAMYGYASIRPNAAGAYYTGLQCGDNTWGGPFSIVLQDESIVTNYIANQYVEFSVNLTKLGLDPAASISSNVCGMPFKSLLVKTRASASFTSELKDFVAPFIFFETPPAELYTVAPSICEEGSISTIFISDPLSTSTYEWLTPDGHIVSSPTGSSITVDTPGTYIVRQYLLAGCAIYSEDTINITLSNGCIALPVDFLNFTGTTDKNLVKLNWQVTGNKNILYFDIERSLDGVNYSTIGRINNRSFIETEAYSFTDEVKDINTSKVHYRIKIITANGGSKYSRTISLSIKNFQENNFSIYPNPVRDVFNISFLSIEKKMIGIEIYDLSGKLIIKKNALVQTGNNTIPINDLSGKPHGLYLVVVNSGSETTKEKILLMK